MCLCLGAYAQDTGQQQNKMNQQDQQFANITAQANHGEIEMGQLAVQHASNEAVKQFARLMIKDHTNAGQELKSWAGQSSFNLPSGLTPEDSSTKTNLSSVSGAQFDQQYLQSQLKDHKTVISEFEKEVAQGQDPQLKQFAEKTLPILQDHVRIAEDIAGKLGMSGKAGLSDASKAVQVNPNQK
jgi:putative membrane protein